MTLSVIIPTLNEQDRILALLSDIDAQTLPPKEVFVVDGESEDATRDKVSSHQSAQLIASKRGVGRQRKHGSDLATGDIVALIDADVRLRPDFFEKAVSQMNRQKLDIACPYYLPTRGGLGIRATYGIINSFFWLFQKVLPSGAGSCILVRRDALARHGGIRPDHVYDDIELIRRIARKGKFAMLSSCVRVSPRRFETYGTARTALKYIALSAFFVFGAFKAAERIKYEFGKHKK